MPSSATTYRWSRVASQIAASPSTCHRAIRSAATVSGRLSLRVRHWRKVLVAGAPQHDHSPAIKRQFAADTRRWCQPRWVGGQVGSVGGVGTGPSYPSARAAAISIRITARGVLDKISVRAVVAGPRRMRRSRNWCPPVLTLTDPVPSTCVDSLLSSRRNSFPS
jgi:hypothetical protein